jgi:hypothetical protein
MKLCSFIPIQILNRNTYLCRAGMTKWYGTGLRAGYLGVRVWQGLGICLLTTTSILALGPTQPPIQWVAVSLSLG